MRHGEATRYLSSLFVVALCGCMEKSTQHSPERTTAVYGDAAGRLTESYPSVFHLRMPGPTPTQSHSCTGSLVAPRRILTAAHCVTDDWRAPRLHPGEVVKLERDFNQDRIPEVFHQARVQRIDIPATWGQGKKGSDVAVIVVSADIPRLGQPMQIDQRPAPIGASVVQMGYCGWNGNGRPGRHYLTGGNTRIAAKYDHFNTNRLSDRYAYTTLGMSWRGAGNPDWSKISGCNGDSGAPLVHRGFIVGVTSTIGKKFAVDDDIANVAASYTTHVAIGVTSPWHIDAWLRTVLPSSSFRQDRPFLSSVRSRANRDGWRQTILDVDDSLRISSEVQPAAAHRAKGATAVAKLLWLSRADRRVRSWDISHLIRFVRGSSRLRSVASLGSNERLEIQPLSADEIGAGTYRLLLGYRVAGGPLILNPEEALSFEKSFGTSQQPLLSADKANTAPLLDLDADGAFDWNTDFRMFKDHVTGVGYPRISEHASDTALRWGANGIARHIDSDLGLEVLDINGDGVLSALDVRVLEAFRSGARGNVLLASASPMNRTALELEAMLHVLTSGSAPAPSTSLHWSFEDNARSGGSGDSEYRLYGTPSLQDGRVGSALAFDERDDYVRIPKATYGSDFTIAFWFNSAQARGSDYQYMYSHGAIGAQDAINVYLVEDDNPDHTAGVVRTYLGCMTFDSMPGLSDGRWHSYVFVNSGGVGSIYIDGQAIGGLPVPGGFAPRKDLFIGSRYDADPSRMYGGRIDELRIFDRALATYERAALLE